MKNFLIATLFCLSVCSCTDSKYNIISKKLDNDYLIEIDGERFYENSSGVNVNLLKKGVRVDGPVFIGSISDPKKINLKVLKFDSLIGVVWEKPTGEKTLVYIYSVTSNLGWPGDKEKITPDQLGDIKNTLISKSPTDIGSNVVFGEIE